MEFYLLGNFRSLRTSKLVAECGAPSALPATWLSRIAATNLARLRLPAWLVVM